MKGIPKEPISEQSPLTIMKDGVEEESNEAGLAALVMQKEKYEKDRKVIAQLLPLRSQVQGEAQSKRDDTVMPKSCKEPLAINRQF